MKSYFNIIVFLFLAFGNHVAKDELVDFNLQFAVHYFLPLEEATPVKIKLWIDGKELINNTFSLDQRGKVEKGNQDSTQGTEIKLKLNGKSIHKLKVMEVESKIVYETKFNIEEKGSYLYVNYNFFPESHPSFKKRGFDFLISKHRFMEE